MGKPTFCNVVFGIVSNSLGAVSRFTLWWRYLHPEYIGVKKQTRGTETSKYPEERISTETLLVAASERGSGLCLSENNWNLLESWA